MNIYISGCTRVDIGKIVEISTLLESSGHHVSFYTKNSTYSTEALEQSDAVVFVLPNWNFQCPLSHMSQGSLKELVYCINHKRDIYMSYKSEQGLRVYAAMITDNLCISGIPATYMNLDTMGSVLDHTADKETYITTTERFY